MVSNSAKILFQAGWGKSETDAHTVDILREVSVNIVDTMDCFLNDHDMARVSSRRTFCAGGVGVGPCTGDSGNTEV